MRSGAGLLPTCLPLATSPCQRTQGSVNDPPGLLIHLTPESTNLHIPQSSSPLHRIRPLGAVTLQSTPLGQEPPWLLVPYCQTGQDEIRMVMPRTMSANDHVDHKGRVFPSPTVSIFSSSSISLYLMAAYVVLRVYSRPLCVFGSQMLLSPLYHRVSCPHHRSVSRDLR
jgi:hypothetical protein